MDDAFGVARTLYGDAMRFVARSFELAAENDEVRWAREDLQEELLDLKRAVIEGNSRELAGRIAAAARMLGLLDQLIRNAEESE